MAIRNRANLQAGILIEKALNSGKSLAEISEKIGVGISTLQRWRATGKGEAVLVRKLELFIGSIEITPDDSSTLLVDEYSKSGSRSAFAIFDSDLYRVVGPLLDAKGYLEEVREKLRLRGFELLQTRKGGKIIYHVISFARLNKITSGNIRDMRDRWKEIPEELMSHDDDEIDK